ncbi:uncharacterized protein L203_104820 [Cryptococcus depauperatus CBS 7841]|uniref:DUF726 family protein n=1 Tax=Cryptococcus depauperatus CBS 7841 TaxID=1295531 RepID=A0AAJ8M2W6_9TREE
MTDSEATCKSLEPLAPPIRLILAFAASCATEPPIFVDDSARKWYNEASERWLESFCKILAFDRQQLPPLLESANVKAAADEQRAGWTQEDVNRICDVLVESSVASEAEENAKNGKKHEALRYTPIARALSYHTLELLGLPPRDLIPRAEKNLAQTLFKALKYTSEGDQQEQVESTRAAHSQGWGGTLGRHLATGAGVIAGGVLLGVTGGLAAPAIAAVLAPLGIGTVLSASTAPVILGTLFGIGGGGLAGRRVRERWKGVEEFSFIEVGDGHKATQEEINDLLESSQRVEQSVINEGVGKSQEVESEDVIRSNTLAEELEGSVDNEQAAKNVQKGRLSLEQRLLDLTLSSDTHHGISANSVTVKGVASADTVNHSRRSLDLPKEEKQMVQSQKPPSLTATIVAPGLLTISRTEAISAWRAICCSQIDSQVTLAPRVVPRDKRHLNIHDNRTTKEERSGLKDGRDVYVLRFESAAMLKTGRDIDFWVESKLKSLLKKEIIKRTLLSAYFAAISLPLSVYSMATMTLDNTWMHAQDRAKKAGRLLGEVIEKRVQGERPVILIGSSVGGLTILHALLYLASLPPPSPSNIPIPTFVESAFLISLPAAPTDEEWTQCRSVVSRRLVNAYSDSDLVLAGVVRLHEVVSKAAVMSSGVRVAGLASVEHQGVENVDVSSVLRGHMELQAKMPDILRIIDIDT